MLAHARDTSGGKDRATRNGDVPISSLITHVGYVFFSSRLTGDAEVPLVFGIQRISFLL